MTGKWRRRRFLRKVSYSSKPTMLIEDLGLAGIVLRDDWGNVFVDIKKLPNKNKRKRK